MGEFRGVVSALLQITFLLFATCHSKDFSYEGFFDGVDGSKFIPDFEEAIKRLKSTIHLIRTRFSLDDKYRSQLFDVAANMNTNAWDILKLKFVLKIMGENLTEREFMMIFGGSSVTAGHDNYFRESYPLVFERRMKPALEALNIKLIVHNIAQGSNDCYPYNFCYESMGGSNPDWIGWEQSYNCGRDLGIFELIARLAAWNKAVVYFSASGGFIPDTCAPSEDPIPWISENWTPHLVGIEEMPRISHKDILEERKKLHEWYMDGNSVSKFVAGLNTREDAAKIYAGIGAHGFNWFGSSKSKCFDDLKNRTGCNAIDVRGKCQRDGGPHWMTLEAAKYTATSHGKKWHPSAGMHLLRGEIIAFRYSYILLDAIYTVQEGLKLHKSYLLKRKLGDELLKLQPDLASLSPIYCDDICKFRPKCFTDFEPNYNNERKMSTIIREGNHVSNGWIRTQFKKDVPGLGNSQYGWLDRRPIYELHGINTSISFVLDVRLNSIALICGYPVKDSLRYAGFYLDQNVNVKPGEKYTPSSSIRSWNRKKYFNSECTILTGLPIGQHILTVKNLVDGLKSSLSHVICY